MFDEKLLGLAQVENLQVTVEENSAIVNFFDSNLSTKISSKWPKTSCTYTVELRGDDKAKSQEEKEIILHDSDKNRIQFDNLEIGQEYSCFVHTRINGTEIAKASQKITI